MPARVLKAWGQDLQDGDAAFERDRDDSWPSSCRQSNRFFLSLLSINLVAHAGAGFLFGICRPGARIRLAAAGS